MAWHWSLEGEIMTKNFWLVFALQEALSVLTAFGATMDPATAPQQQAAALAIQNLIAALTSPAPVAK